MIGRPLVSLLAGCAIFGTVIVLELRSAEQEQTPVATSSRAEFKPIVRPSEPAPDELAATSVARPLFNPTRRPAEKVAQSSGGEPDLSDVRLTGIVVRADRPLARSEERRVGKERRTR